jgi:1-acyl-sn-glycerol-3-phosphate acyltransferase
VVGTPKNCIDILEHSEAVIAFPEGVRGMNKPFSQRYQLQEFENGFMRLALQTNTPIHDEDEVIVKKVDQVKRRIEAMLGEGLRRRQSIFF